MWAFGMGLLPLRLQILAEKNSVKKIAYLKPNLTLMPPSLSFNWNCTHQKLYQQKFKLKKSSQGALTNSGVLKVGGAKE